MKQRSLGTEKRRRKEAAYAELIRQGRQRDMSAFRRPPYAGYFPQRHMRQEMEGEEAVKERKRMENAMLGSWEDVDMALKAIAAANNELAVINGSMNMQIDALKEASDNMAQPYREEIKKQELLIREFVQANRNEMKGKSRKLTFGTVGFRMSTKLALPREVKKVIALLRRNGMDDCITIKEGVNKDVLRTYAEKDILKVGGKLKKEDVFYYETDKLTISEG